MKKMKPAMGRNTKNMENQVRGRTNMNLVEMAVAKQNKKVKDIKHYGMMPERT